VKFEAADLDQIRRGSGDPTTTVFDQQAAKGIYPKGYAAVLWTAARRLMTMTCATPFIFAGKISTNWLAAER